MTLKEKIEHLDPETFDDFLSQLREMLDGVDLFLTKGEHADEEELYEAFRLVHRCKGDAQFLALEETARIARMMNGPMREAYQASRNLTQQERTVVTHGLEQMRAYWDLLSMT